MKANKEQIVSYIMACKAIAETIRELGETNAGALYAGCMASMSLDTFNGIMGRLQSAGLVEVTPAHVVRWIGPR